MARSLHERSARDVDSALPATRDKVPAIADRIERYCAEHPGAADSAEGVQRWWLSGCNVLVEEVQAALDELVARGSLSRRVLGDGTVVYFCNQAHCR